MIGTSIPEYIFIRVCILALRAVTPLSIFYIAFSIAEPPSSIAGRLLLSWCAIETAFWLLVYLPKKRSLQAAAQHPPLLDRDERRELFWKCWEKIPHPEYYLNKWFLGANPADVKRENIKDFFRWALFNTGDRTGEVKAEEVELIESQEAELNEYADGIQTLLGRPLEPGRGKAKCLRLTVDKVKMVHRPGIWYLVGNSTLAGLEISLLAPGFRDKLTRSYRLSGSLTRSLLPFFVIRDSSCFVPPCTPHSICSPSASPTYSPAASPTPPILAIGTSRTHPRHAFPYSSYMG
jgi:hypothetical protein